MPSNEIERRNSPRRLTDRILDDLYQTYSTKHCHKCLERAADVVMLLDQEGLLLYATPNAQPIMKKLKMTFALNQKIIFPDTQSSTRIKNFINPDATKTEPLCFLINESDNQERLLFICFRLPKPEKPNPEAARFMFKIRDPSHFSQWQWQILMEQFCLTKTECKLCKSLVNGLSLNEYAVDCQIAISTARSQLSNVLAKTATKRQSDLLRLIFLFARA
jgi:DNA-binding CsgD family transcriptional regulator